jgi:hypothetical protein
VLALRRKGTRAAADARILGGDQFVEDLLKEAEERVKNTLRLSGQVPELGSLARKIATQEGVSEPVLRSGSRTRSAARARKILCQWAVRKHGYSGAEVARFLGVTTSAVNRAAGSEEPPALAKHT